MLSTALAELKSDLPWVDRVRIVVGPLASRESVKDALLFSGDADVLPAWAVGTLAELAAEIVRGSGGRAARPLSAASRVDALWRVAESGFLRERLPRLAGHLRARDVASKVSRFITNLDRFYVHDADLDAVVEYYKTRDPQLGAFVEIIVLLWRQGELRPWGEGDVLRAALDSVGAPTKRLKVWLWGFKELTPLEEAFLERLASAHDVTLLEPASLVAASAPRAKAMGLSVAPLEGGERSVEPRGELSIDLWRPHSVWDELEFLGDAFERLRAEGARWDEIAVFTPQENLYKRLVRRKLKEWNIPIQDPTLADGWNDVPEWLRARDLLKTLAGGLKLEDVRPWLGQVDGARELFERALRRGVHGGASQWAKLLEIREIPELRALVEGVRIFGRSMTPARFADAVDELQEFHPSAVLAEFATHLVEDRPYLEGFRGRLSRFVPLFEEFLGLKARESSLRADGGVHFVNHGVWLPKPPLYSFVLGAGAIVPARPAYDPWDWEGLEVRRAWEGLHFGLPRLERLKREEELLLHGLLARAPGATVAVSAPAHDLSGNPWAEGMLVHRLRSDLDAPELARAGGHAAVGWTAGAEIRPSALAGEKRPELLENALSGGALKISAFEDYLKCPFLFFGRHVLKLESETELGLDPDAKVRGKILHRVLERFIAGEIAGEPLASERLLSLLDEELAKGNALEGMYRHRPLVARTRAILAAHALKWLEWEIENRKAHPEVRPVAVEMPVELEVGGLSLKGKLDRLDSDGKHALVVDYKSGGAGFIGKELLAGTGSQLLMYLFAASRARSLEPGGAYYVSVRRSAGIPGGVFLKTHQKKLYSVHGRNSGLTDETAGTLFERVTETWARAAERLRGGDFTAAPARPKKDCPRCQFQSVCGFRDEGATDA